MKLFRTAAAAVLRDATNPPVLVANTAVPARTRPQSSRKAAQRQLVPLLGFQELTVAEEIVMQAIMSQIARVYCSYGYVPLDTRLVEPEGILKEKGIDGKEVYALGRLREDEIETVTIGDQRLALRFDLTVPLARYVAQNHKWLHFPFKRYQMQKVYRGESAKEASGRFREFYQLDIDVIGQGSQLALEYDCELALVVFRIFSQVMGLQDQFVIRVNNRKVLQGMLEEFGVAATFIKDAIKVVDDIEKLAPEEIAQRLLRVGLDRSKVDSLCSIFNVCRVNNARVVVDALRNLRTRVKSALLANGIEELAVVIQGILDAGVPANHVALDLSIARGLDYYTGTVFETVLVDHPDLGSVCSGGRYANLVGALSGEKMEYPGTGVSIGLSRLVPLLIRRNVLKASRESTATVLVTTQDPSLRPWYTNVAERIRSSGTNCLMLYDGKLKTQLKYADLCKIPFVVLANADEAQRGVVQVKTIASHTQREVAVEELSYFDWRQDDVSAEETTNQTAATVVDTRRRTPEYSQEDVEEVSALLGRLMPSMASAAPRTPVQVTVTTVSQTPIADAVRGVGANQVAVLWYIGAHGTREETELFYAPHVATLQSRGTRCYLLDLSAWGAFHDPNCKLDAASSANTSRPFSSTRIITSNQFFANLRQKMADPNYRTLLEQILRRHDMFTASATHVDAGIHVRDKLPELPEFLHAYDMSKVYSALQYLELCYLIQHIATDFPRRKLDISFILPNDEDKYYPLQWLKQDVEHYLCNAVCDAVSIRLATFPFGRSVSDRPYNTVKKVIL